MGSSFVYRGLSRLCVYAAARWHAAVPCQSSPVSPGAASRARWLPADLVCRVHWPLSFLLLACAVSREQHHAQASAGECGRVAPFFLLLGKFFHTDQPHRFT